MESSEENNNKPGLKSARTQGFDQQPADVLQHEGVLSTRDR